MRKPKMREITSKVNYHGGYQIVGEFSQDNGFYLRNTQNGLVVEDMNIKKVTITTEEGELVFVAWMDNSNMLDILNVQVTSIIYQYAFCEGIKLTIEIK